MSSGIYLIVGIVAGFSGLLSGVLLTSRYDKLNYFLVCMGIGMTIMIFCMVAQQLDYNAQREIYDKTIFQPWVKSLDSKSCEQLGDAILKQKLLENKTAIDAGLKVFNQKECHFDISSGHVLEMLK